jgi:hypothetical protein
MPPGDPRGKMNEQDKSSLTKPMSSGRTEREKEREREGEGR